MLPNRRVQFRIPYTSLTIMYLLARNIISHNLSLDPNKMRSRGITGHSVVPESRGRGALVLILVKLKEG